MSLLPPSCLSSVPQLKAPSGRYNIESLVCISRLTHIRIILQFLTNFFNYTLSGDISQDERDLSCDERCANAKKKKQPSCGVVFVEVGWFLWHINLYRLFNAKFIFIQIISSVSNSVYCPVSWGCRMHCLRLCAVHRVKYQNSFISDNPL